MGSTDSAGSTHGGGPSCGLVSSLFPSSCRGRAEAFARRLHRRLTSLGGEDDDSSQRNLEGTKVPHETSWLHPTAASKAIVTKSISSNHVLQRQPRHSPESELYYDFDIDLEDDAPGSPAEEVTAAELARLLVNPKVAKSNCHDDCKGTFSESKASTDANQDPESGCVFASPITGTSPDSISDSSEVYFDPESSDMSEKPKDEVFFDPVSTSESDVTSNLSNGYLPVNLTALSCHQRTDKSLGGPEDTSDSSCSSSRRNETYGNCRKEELCCSSEDSLNGRSSLETTSPSHESLWSTFDESTVSLQDESPSRGSCNSVVPRIHLPKSHSDSEIPVNGGGRIDVPRKLNRSGEENVDNVDVDEVDFVNGSSNGDEVDEDIKNAKNIQEEHQNCRRNDVESNVMEDATEVPEMKLEVSRCLLGVKAEESGTSDTDTDHSTYSSTINIPGALTLECPSGERVTEEILKNEVKLQIENGTILNGSDEEKMCLLLKNLHSGEIVEDENTSRENRRRDNTVEDDEEEEEEEENRPRRVRRCSSLKTGKTPPGTPGRKKIVRFADVLGLDLADVRTFLDEIPKIPNSAYSDLIYDDIFQKDTSPVNTISSGSWNNRYAERQGAAPAMLRKDDRTLVPLFQQPGGMPNFLDLVRERRVCLENVFVQDPVSLCIRGTVRVINLDFHKSVHIRYTLNAWKNFSDLQATYVPNSCDGLSDKFSFVLYCHTLPVGQRLEFAVRFHCKGTQYWDNNDGANYCFQCLPISSTVEYIPITTTENQTTEWTPTFY